MIDPRGIIRNVTELIFDENGAIFQVSGCGRHKREINGGVASGTMHVGKELITFYIRESVLSSIGIFFYSHWSSFDSSL